MRYIVEILCSGMGFAGSRFSGDTLDSAIKAESELLANDAPWVDPPAPHTTRIRDTIGIYILHSRLIYKAFFTLKNILNSL